MAYTREQFLAVGHKPEIVNDMYDFYRRMSGWKIDSCIAACITMFCCFDPRIPTLQNTQLVRKIQEGPKLKIIKTPQKWYFEPILTKNQTFDILNIFLSVSCLCHFFTFLFMTRYFTTTADVLRE